MRLLPARPTALPAVRTRATLQRPSVVTASATPINRETSPGLRRLNQEWHAAALARYRDVGECWYPAQFYSRTMQKVRFFPAILDEKGDVQEVDSGPLAQLWDRIQDPGGGRTELTGSYGHLMFLIGDGYLVVSDNDGEEVWEYLSPLELRVQPEGIRQEYRRIRAPGITPEELVEANDNDFEPMGNSARVYRLYRRDPGYSAWSDSPVRAVLDLYQLLRLLTLAAGAEAQSRAANRGLLYVPEDLSFTPANAADGDDDMRNDTFADDLIQGFMHAISNPGDASAMAPAIIRGPGLAMTGQGIATPMADLIKWLPLGPADSYRAVEVAEKVITRLGNGLDLPGQIVTGEARNHWGDWLIDEQGFRQHVAPVCDKFGSDLVAAYLRPAAKDAGIAEWERVAIGYDPTEAVNHPDETETVKDAHDRLVISDAYYRDTIGATDDDAPDEAELERRTLVKINVDPYAEPVVEGETAPQDGGTGNDTVEAPPEAPPEQNGNGAATASALVVAKILGAAESHVTRTRSIAGARLTRRSQSCSECQEKARAVHVSMVASALGAETVRGIIEGHGSESDLVGGAGEELADTLRRWGVAGEWPDQIGRQVEQHALRTLYEQDPPPLPSGFSSVVAKALAA